MADVVEVRPGDVLVLCSDNPVTRQVADELKALVGTRLPGVGCLVISSSFSVLVYRGGTDGRP